MPNHTTNKLTIKGTSVDKFIEDATTVLIDSEEKEYSVPLSFNALYPTPDEAFENEDYKYVDGEFQKPDWYEWRLENWGTKWDCYDHHGDWNDNEITFFTAWSPPTAFFMHVSQNYPDITFMLDFADEGAGFLGSQTIKDGELIAEADLEWNSEEGIELRDSLGVYYPEEE